MKLLDSKHDVTTVKAIEDKNFYFYSRVTARLIVCVLAVDLSVQLHSLTYELQYFTYFFCWLVRSEHVLYKYV